MTCQGARMTHRMFAPWLMRSHRAAVLLLYVSQCTQL